MHSWDIMEFLKKQELSKAMAVWNLEPVENTFLKELSYGPSHQSLWQPQLTTTRQVKPILKVHYFRQGTRYKPET